MIPQEEQQRPFTNNLLLTNLTMLSGCAIITIERNSAFGVYHHRCRLRKRCFFLYITGLMMPGKEGTVMNKTQIKKMCLAAMLIAIGVVGSAINFPIGASKCCPAQAFVNVLSGVLLGPWYAAGVGFGCALIRNILGTGTLLAFPGSIFGAILAGLIYHKVKQWIVLAAAGEVFGTAVIGGIVAFPVARFIMNNEAAALFGYVVPFLVSSAGGAIIAFVLLEALDKTGVLKRALPSPENSNA